MGSKECGDDCTLIFWTKIGFILGVFCEAFFAGIIPTCSSKVRESPKILGIANAFAAGVFLAIALMHILPEQVETWADYTIERKGADAKIFPLAELVTFFGYTFILLIDKVLFDTHALFDHDDEQAIADPAEAKLAKNLKESMNKHQEVVENGTASKEDVRASKVETQKDMQQSMKEYLNPNDRFAQRMKASLKGQEESPESEAVEEQKHLFIENVAVELKTSNAS